MMYFRSVWEDTAALCFDFYYPVFGFVYISFRGLCDDWKNSFYFTYVDDCILDLCPILRVL